MTRPRKVAFAAMVAMGAVVLSCGSTVRPTVAPAPSAPISSARTATHVEVSEGPRSTSGRIEALEYVATRLADGRILLTGGFVRAETEAVCAKIEAAGQVCSPPATATAEIYDPRTRSFTPTGSMTMPRRDHQAVLLHDGRVLVTGGLDGDLASVDAAEIFDPAAGRFSSVGPLHQVTGGTGPSSSPSPPGPRPTTLDHQTIVVLGDGRVVFAGGLGVAGTSSDAVTIFEPRTNTFTNLPGMPVRWDDAIGTLLPDGRVLLMNGIDTANGKPTDQALLFDPATDTFTTTGRTAVIREGGDAAILPDGRVLIVGGQLDPFAAEPNCGTPAPAELYDPPTGQFTTVAGMRPASPVMALPASGGGVLLLGGSTGDCTPLRQVEAYDPVAGAVSLLASGVLPADPLEDAFTLDDGSVLLLTDKGVDVLTLR